MKALESYHTWPVSAMQLFKEMRETPQSPIHHAEGDVYTHTQMVVSEVLKWTHLETMLFTAILHDIAKPLTTVFEDGDYHSPGHAKLGERIAREVLESSFALQKREEIAAMVRYHGLPIWWAQKQNPKMAVIKASLRCDLSKLAEFAECDFRGRVCRDLDDALFKIDLFEEFAEKLGCLHNPYPFPSDWSRLSFFKRDTYEMAPIYEPEGAWFVLLCGLPGAGKSTWVEKNWDGAVVEMDEIRKRLKIKPDDKDAQGLVHQTAKEEVRIALRKQQDVLWNATSLTEQQRSAIIDIALQYKAKIKIIYFDAPLELIVQRNKTRDERNQMPLSVIKKMYRKLEIPTLAECHQLQIISAST